MLTIDANVFVSARNRAEPQQDDSDRFLKRLVEIAALSYCPTLVVPETAAGLFRPTRNANLSRTAVAQIVGFPSLTLVPLTEDRARRTAEVVLLHHLRGADAAYVTVAQEFGTILVTWDVELLTRGAQAIPTMTPTEWLTANPAS